MVTDDCGTITSMTSRVRILDYISFVNPGLVAQGLDPITLTALVFCDTGNVTYEWRNEFTGDIEGTDPTLLLVPEPTETTLYRLTVTDPVNGVSTAFSLVLVNPNSNGEDPNGDNENTVEDLHFVVPNWGGESDFEVDGDETLTILDLLYINTGL